MACQWDVLVSPVDYGGVSFLASRGSTRLVYILDESTQDSKHAIEVGTVQHLCFTEQISLPKMLSRGGRWLPQTWELSGTRARNSQVKNDRGRGSEGRVGFMPGNKFSIKQ